MVGSSLKKCQTSVFSSRKSPQKPLSSASVPPREAKKRKGVHFDQPSINEELPSTSDDDESTKWKYIASSFGLTIDDSNDRREEENRELIKLCNFYADSEEPDRAATDNGDDDEEALPFKMFAEQGMRISYKKTTTLKAPTVSSLDLTNLCRLNSRPNIASKKLEKIEEGEEENVPSSIVLEETEQIEMAFQGSLPCNNSPQNVAKKKALMTKAKQPTLVVEKQKSEADFWNDVEFDF